MAVTMNNQELEKLRIQSDQTSLATVIHALDVFQQTLDKMKRSNQRIELEMAFVRLCSPELDSTKEALIRRIDMLEQRKYVAPTVEKVNPSVIVKQEEKPQAKIIKEKPQPSQKELQQTAVLFKNWQDVVTIIKQYSKVIGVAFSESKAYISGDYMLIQGSELAFEYLRNNQAYKDKLREAIYSITGKNYKLGPYKNQKIVEEKADKYASIISEAEKSGIPVEIVEN